ncbi:MAG: hydrolase [Bacteroidales bacterium]|nr:hydrolase [Bacteroidales bacterium]
MTPKKNIPRVSSRLRHNILKTPAEIRRASGILIYGRRIKSLIFTTDIAIIRNCDADAVMAVYPFTPQQTISDSIIKHSSRPVFCGIGGGTTKGLRTVSLAKDVESQGAMAVVLNAPSTNEDLRAVAGAVEIPVIITVVSPDTDILGRIQAGASILNVAGGRQTVKIVRQIRNHFPETPIIATGGRTAESILATIEAGANAITYTPPSIQEMFRQMMDNYRGNDTDNSSREVHLGETWLG